MTLTEFLLARIAEDEQQAEDYWPSEALAPQPGTWMHWMRAECEAKRRIVGHYEWPHAQNEILRAIALPYADHPDYRQEWAV